MEMCHYDSILLSKAQPEKCSYMIPGYLTLFSLDKSLSLLPPLSLPLKHIYLFFLYHNTPSAPVTAPAPSPAMAS